jgi:hypothetical protein
MYFINLGKQTWQFVVLQVLQTLTLYITYDCRIGSGRRTRSISRLTAVSKLYRWRRLKTCFDISMITRPEISQFCSKSAFLCDKAKTFHTVQSPFETGSNFSRISKDVVCHCMHLPCKYLFNRISAKIFQKS